MNNNNNNTMALGSH